MEIYQNTRHKLNPKTNRFVCTPENPMPKGAAGRWEHDAEEIGTCMDDCCADYRCKNCGHRWREELPQ